MFIQVIEGRTDDPDALHERLDLWQRELMPGAEGYLGSTGGCTSDGSCILVARFESREAAQRNSDRPEQGEWWAETERCFTGPVTFHDSTEVEEMRHGSPDQARFVQVMEGHVSDKARAIEIEHEADAVLAERRPELLASLTAYYDDDAYTSLAYFTDERSAREGERADMPEDTASGFAEWQDVMRVERYLDLTQPWMVTPTV